MNEAIKKAKAKLEEMEQDPAAFWDEEAHEAYDTMLDECCTCETCGRGGSDLKENDPIAYRCGFSDYMDGDTARDFAKEQDSYKDLEDFIEAAEAAQGELNDAVEELNDHMETI